MLTADADTPGQPAPFNNHYDAADISISSTGDPVALRRLPTPNDNVVVNHSDVDTQANTQQLLQSPGTQVNSGGASTRNLIPQFDDVPSIDHEALSDNEGSGDGQQHQHEQGAFQQHVRNKLTD